MTAPVRLPALPAPPHDPYSLLLAGWIGADAWAGFRIASVSDIAVAAPSNVLMLGPTPDAARLLTEPSGSFAGRRPPFNVAVARGGDIFVLDLAHSVLRRYDPCDCRFVTVGCMKGAEDPAPNACDLPAAAPRPSKRPRLDRLREPHGIAICEGDLWIADSGHGRVIGLSLATLAPHRGVLLPRAEQAKLAMPWYPFGIALDGAGRLYVSDPNNGRIDRFDAQQRWIDVVLSGVPGVQALAVDCTDTIYGLVPASFALAPLALPAAGTVYATLDAGTRGFDWQQLRATDLPLAALVDIDVTASDDALSSAQLALLSSGWRRAASAAHGAVGGLTLPLAGAIGRHLYVRLTARTGSVAAAAVKLAAQGASVVRVGAGGGAAIDPRGDRLPGFPRTPIVVDLQGRLHLGCANGLALFTANGEPVTASTVAPAMYKSSGTLTTVALDAEIDGCQWHRVELCGHVPLGCSIEVRTTTSMLALDDAEVVALPDAAWWTLPIASGPIAGRWDCLVRSPPGRYCWVHLTLHGDGHATPCIESVTVEYPRISVRRYLPAVFGADAAGADFTDRFTAIFDATLRSVEAKLDGQAAYFDPLSTPSTRGRGSKVDFLSWLASWVGAMLPPEWSEERRRRYFKQATRLVCQRGTPSGLRQQLLLLLGFDEAYANCLDERPRTRCIAPPRNCGPAPKLTPAEPPPLILEHYRLRRWLYAGRGRLGDDAVLWGKRIVNRSELSGPSQASAPNGNARVGETQLISVPDPLHDPFRVYANRFSVFVPARVRDCDAERRVLERLLAREAPAHTAYDIRYVEPRFRVGTQATIGLDSVVARTPGGVTLGEGSLGQATVLSGPPQRRGAPRLAVGNAKVGLTARVD